MLGKIIHRYSGCFEEFRDEFIKIFASKDKDTLDKVANDFLLKHQNSVNTIRAKIKYLMDKWLANNKEPKIQYPPKPKWKEMDEETLKIQKEIYLNEKSKVSAEFDVKIKDFYKRKYAAKEEYTKKVLSETIGVEKEELEAFSKSDDIRYAVENIIIKEV